MGDSRVVIAALCAGGAALAASRVPAALWPAIACSGAFFAAMGAYRRRAIQSTNDLAQLVLSAVGLLAVVSGGVGFRSAQDLASLDRPRPARVEGIAELGSDPESSAFGTNFELIAVGRRWAASAGRGVESMVSELRTGDRIRMSARVSDLDRAPREWVLSRHLAGRLDLHSAEPLPGTRPWFRAANGVHELLERGAGSMDQTDRSLYLGLVVGDDRDQSELTRFQFQASGLTHLLAVSGQNLVFVLAVLAPLSRRLTHRARWILGVAAIAGFVLITRAEPSVLRAATMAVLGLTAAGTGRKVSGVRLVSLTVIVLLLADPMLVYSVGFRLSVAATLGLVLFTRRVEAHLVGPTVVRLPLAVTLSAQLGAVPVMAATFGKVSLVAVPANLLAEPAAGLVMTLGMTTGLVSGIVREQVAWVLQVPVRAAVSWVDGVGASSSQLAVPPSGPFVWLVVVGAWMWAALLWGGGGSSVRQRSIASSRPTGSPRSRTGPGRALVVAVVPMLVLLRPPVPGRTPPPDLPGEAELVAACDQWVLEVGPASLDESGAVEILESLWQAGVTRVAEVRVVRPLDGTVSPKVSSGGPETIADQLRAELVTVEQASSSGCG